MSKTTKSTLKAVFIDFSRQQLTEVKEVDSTRSRKEIWGLFFKEIPGYVSRRSAKITLVEQNGEYKYRLIKRNRKKYIFLIMWCTLQDCVPDPALIQFSAASAELKSIYKAAEKHFYLRTIGRKAAAGVATIALSAYAGGAFKTPAANAVNKELTKADRDKKNVAALKDGDTFFYANHNPFVVEKNKTFGEIIAEYKQKFNQDIAFFHSGTKVPDKDNALDHEGQDIQLVVLEKPEKKTEQPTSNPPEKNNQTFCEGIEVIRELSKIDYESDTVPILIDPTQLAKIEKTLKEKKITISTATCEKPPTATETKFGCVEFREIMKMYYRLAKSDMLDVLPTLLQSSFCKTEYLIFTEPCAASTKSDLSDLLDVLLVLQSQNLLHLKYQRLSCKRLDIASTNENARLLDEEISKYMPPELRGVMKPHVWVDDYEPFKLFFSVGNERSTNTQPEKNNFIFGDTKAWASPWSKFWEPPLNSDKLKEKVLAIFHKEKLTANFLPATDMLLMFKKDDNLEDSKTQLLKKRFVRCRHPGTTYNKNQFMDVLGYDPETQNIEGVFAVLGKIGEQYHLICSVDDKADQLSSLSNDLFTFIQSALLYIVEKIDAGNEIDNVDNAVKKMENGINIVSTSTGKRMPESELLGVQVKRSDVIEACLLQVHLLQDRKAFFGKNGTRLDSTFMMNPCFHPDMLKKPITSVRRQPGYLYLIKFWQAKLEGKNRSERWKEVEKIFASQRLKNIYPTITYEAVPPKLKEWKPTPIMIHTCPNHFIGTAKEKVDTKYCIDLIRELATQRRSRVEQTDTELFYSELGYDPLEEIKNPGEWKDFAYGILCNLPDDTWRLLIRNSTRDLHSFRQVDNIKRLAMILKPECDQDENKQSFLLYNSGDFLFSPFLIPEIFLDDNIKAVTDSTIDFATKIRNLYTGGYEFPKWVLKWLEYENKVTGKQSHESIVFYNNKDDIKSVKRMAIQREPCNISMSREYDQPKLKELVGYEQGAYASAPAGKLMPNIAVYCQASVDTSPDSNNEYKKIDQHLKLVHVINLVGFAFDSYEQPDYKAIDTEEDLITKYSQMWQLALACALKLKTEGKIDSIWLFNVGGGAFRPYTDKYHTPASNKPMNYKEEKDFVDKVFKPSFAAVLPHFLRANITIKGLTTEITSTSDLHVSNFLPRDRAAVPAIVTEENAKNTLFVNAWDPWSLVGNGNFSDRSLDGWWGRSSNMSVLCWPLTNPEITYRPVHIDDELWKAEQKKKEEKEEKEKKEKEEKEEKEREKEQKEKQEKEKKEKENDEKKDQEEDLQHWVDRYNNRAWSLSAKQRCIEKILENQEISEEIYLKWDEKEEITPSLGKEATSVLRDFKKYFLSTKDKEKQGEKNGEIEAALAQKDMKFMVKNLLEIYNISDDTYRKWDGKTLSPFLTRDGFKFHILTYLHDKVVLDLKKYQKEYFDPNPFKLWEKTILRKIDYTRQVDNPVFKEAFRFYDLQEKSEYTLPEISKKYRILSLKNHPDKNMSAPAEGPCPSTECFKYIAGINGAFKEHFMKQKDGYVFTT